MLYYIYILHSKKDGKLYIGYADDLRKRINKHNRGSVRSTKDRRPLELIHYEAYRRELDAKRREKYLKGGKGHRELKVQLKDILEEVGYRY